MCVLIVLLQSFLCVTHYYFPADIPYCDEEGRVRLIHFGSENSSMGVVQICYYGVWIPICGQDWNDVEASLACQQLGFSGEEWLFFHLTL